MDVIIEQQQKFIDLQIRGMVFINTGEQTAFVSLTGQPEDNTNLKRALDNIKIYCISETLTGTIDNENCIFRTAYNIDDTKIIEVFVNGLKETNWTKTGNKEITFTQAPNNLGYDDFLEIIYYKNNTISDLTAPVLTGRLLNSSDYANGIILNWDSQSNVTYSVYHISGIGIPNTLLIDNLTDNNYSYNVDYYPYDTYQVFAKRNNEISDGSNIVTVGSPP